MTLEGEAAAAAAATTAARHGLEQFRFSVSTSRLQIEVEQYCSWRWFVVHCLVVVAAAVCFFFFSFFWVDDDKLVTAPVSQKAPSPAHSRSLVCSELLSEKKTLT